MQELASPTCLTTTTVTQWTQSYPGLTTTPIPMERAPLPPPLALVVPTAPSTSPFHRIQTVTLTMFM
jgi:hypothetical protein